jgi:cytochrome c oxidase cbb3-type subunit IV
MTNIFTVDASSIMTVISLATFIGIVWWTFIAKRGDDFIDAAQIPFAGEPAGEREQGHE